MATLLTAASATTDIGTGVNLPESKLYRVYVVWTGASITGGVLTLETAQSEGYAATWAVLEAFTHTNASGVQSSYYWGPLAAVRARVSTTVVGGTVSVEFLPLGPG